MSLDNGLLSTDGATASQKSSKLKVVGCIVLAMAATVMLGAAFSRLNASNDEMVALSFAAPRAGAMRGQSEMSVQAAQDTLRMYGIGSSPMERIALSALDINNRRQMGRDVSAKATKEEMLAGMAPKTKQNMEKILAEVEYKESLMSGVTAPLGYFDPLGFSSDCSAGKFLFYREVELKHGRVGMLASLGIIVGEQYHPLFGGNIDVPSAFAFQQTPLEQFWPVVVAAIAIPEVYSVFTFQDPLKGEQWAIKEDHQPGDLGYDPLGLKPEDPTQFKIMQTRELNNGRLAMLAAAGMLAQEYVTGQKIF
eukprot:gnl/TRDRNA2_/TRDRNA2_176696_c0_seq11.p1 gnl/TRDRNA2_/TRDRNA2_176696_c0~~gnl/TRDRNA2_/TRDRNA2_176696_c0_seq11.p1  ORF type:complete len:308 (+),score=77.08 gnl/TRDRNA2_/TRDRNA2_176696_c0_seq11:76-999(+)